MISAPRTNVARVEAATAGIVEIEEDQWATDDGDGESAQGRVVNEVEAIARQAVNFQNELGRRTRR